MDTANPKPQIATLLDDATYGLRDMTDEEIMQLETLRNDVGAWPRFDRIGDITE